MEFIALGLAAVFVIGLLGGLVGAALRRRGPAGQEIERLEKKADWLYREQQALVERIARLERAAGGADAHPPRPAAAAETAAHAPAAAAAEQSVERPSAAPPDVPTTPPAEPAARAPATAATAATREVAPPSPPQAAPARPRTAAESARPANPLVGWLIGGNTVVRVGIVILFFGVAFLLRYAYDRVQVPVELRLTAVAFGAIALLALGWRLRRSRPGYALALQGGGLGVFYLTVFAAMRLYDLLPAGAALVLLTAVAGLSAALALMQNALSLAMLAAGGGFLAPILASTGSGSHVMLFSYYALLNGGILLIARHRAWRPLNLLGFAFTFVIAALWGWRDYRPELWASTQPFLALFFLIYVAIAILYAGHRRPDVRSAVDAGLVFGTPLVGFGLQLALVRDFEFGAAWSAAALGAFYLVVASRLWQRAGEHQRLLVDAFLALGVVFTTLALPLAFDGRWSAAAWALEGAGILWVGLRQNRLAARLFGAALQFGAGALFLLDLPAQSALPLLNGAVLGGLLIALAALASARLIERDEAGLRPWEHWIALALLVWGGLWWGGTLLLEIERQVEAATRLHAALLALSLSFAALGLVAARCGWGAGLRSALGASVLLGWAAAVALLDRVGHPAGDLGWLAWPAAFAVHFALLRRLESAAPRAAPVLHAIGPCAAALLGAWELAWWIGAHTDYGSAWALVAWALVPAAFIAALATQGARVAWPVAAHLRGYLVLAGVPLALWLLAWALFASAASSGTAAPLPYVPILNPLDLAIWGAALAVAQWWLAVRARGWLGGDADSRPVLVGSIGLVGFVLVNGMLLRALHHWAGVPFELDRMLASVVVQTGFSVFWSLLALLAMVAATRLAQRPLWLAGAGLMAVVVIKLFLVDLSNVGGIERIVSFLGVGVLMLVIGFFAPVPPRSTQ